MDVDDDVDAGTAAATAEGTPAPYGRACTNCARAKCRCIYRQGGTDCERCHRLRKECIPSVSVRKRNGKRAHVSRAAQLEAKIEDLVTLLRHQTVPHDARRPESEAGASDRGSLVDNTPAPSSHSVTTQTNASSPTAVVLPPPAPLCAPGRVKPAPIARGSLLGCAFSSDTGFDPAPPVPDTCPTSFYLPTAPEAEERLNTFRKSLLLHLPLMYLPEAMTAEQLRDQYPLVWFCIMAAMCKNIDQRITMAESIRKFFAQKIVVEQEKSLDLLLGLLVSMGWMHFYIYKDKPVLTVLASLAKALVFDLSLNKVPVESYMAVFVRSVHMPPREKTMQERRAVLACFYITSQIALVSKKLDPLMWTPHMNESLQALEAQGEWVGDEVLVSLVKIQLVLDQVTRVMSQAPDTPFPSYYATALKAQLQDIIAKLPRHLQQNDPVLSLFSYAELYIHDAALPKTKNNQAAVTGHAPPNPTLPSLQTYEIREAMLQAVKAWFDRHFSLPAHTYKSMTFHYWCQMGHCLLTLYQLSTYDDPGWDRRNVREQLDIVVVMDRMVAGFDQIMAPRRYEAGHGSIEEDGFGKMSKMLRLMKQAWGLNVPLGPTGLATNAAPSSGGSPAEGIQRTTASAPGISTVGVSGEDVSAFLEGSTDPTLNVPFLPGQAEEYEGWIMGMFDLNWDNYQ